MMGYDAFWTWIAKPSETSLGSVPGGISHARETEAAAMAVKVLENRILFSLSIEIDNV
jgi:hypothetical protein